MLTIKIIEATKLNDNLTWNIVFYINRDKHELYFADIEDFISNGYHLKNNFMSIRRVSSSIKYQFILKILKDYIREKFFSDYDPYMQTK